MSSRKSRQLRLKRRVPQMTTKKSISSSGWMVRFNSCYPVSHSLLNIFFYLHAEFEDSWVLGRDIADDLIEDFDGGLEYAQLSAAYLPPNYSREKGKKAKTKYLVKVRTKAIILLDMFCQILYLPCLSQWSDDATPSWEPKENAKGAAL